MFNRLLPKTLRAAISATVLGLAAGMLTSAARAQEASLQDISHPFKRKQD